MHQGSQKDRPWAQRPAGRVQAGKGKSERMSGPRFLLPTHSAYKKGEFVYPALLYNSLDTLSYPTNNDQQEAEV